MGTPLVAPLNTQPLTGGCEQIQEVRKPENDKVRKRSGRRWERTGRQVLCSAASAGKADEVEGWGGESEERYKAAGERQGRGRGEASVRGLLDYQSSLAKAEEKGRKAESSRGEWSFH
eukprot:751294-Hanusia_phi.AAC.1